MLLVIDRNIKSSKWNMGSLTDPHIQNFSSQPLKILGRIMNLTSVVSPKIMSTSVKGLIPHGSVILFRF